IPEIIISGPRGTTRPSYLYTNELYIINTQTQSVEKKIKTALMYFTGVGNYIVADIDNDCKQEIIIFATDEVRYNYSNPDSIIGRLICYDMEGEIVWISDERVSDDNLRIHPSIFLADINHDGIPELVAGNSIFNARTGVKLCDGGKNGMGLGPHWGGQ